MSFIILKILIDAGFSPFVIITLRFTIGYLFLLFIQITKSRLNKVNETSYSTNFTKAEILSGILAGIILFFSYTFQTTAGETTTPAKNGLYTDLFIIFTPIASMIISRRLKIKPLVSGILAFIGVLIVSDVFSDNRSFMIGDLFSVLCALSFTLHFIVVEKNATLNSNLRQIDPLNFTMIQFMTVAMISLIVMVFNIDNTNTVTLEMFDPTVIIAIMFLGITSTALTYFAQFKIQNDMSANKISFLYSFEAVFATSFSLIFGYDSFKWTLIIGALVLVFATVISSLNLKALFSHRCNKTDNIKNDL
jgi:drug/metabolite transporter (DMT)-like permease